jgi:hypothetical protein
MGISDESMTCLVWKYGMFGQQGKVGRVKGSFASVFNIC